MYKSFKVLKANYWWFYAEIFAFGNVRSFLTLSIPTIISLQHSSELGVKQ